MLQAMRSSTAPHMVVSGLGVRVQGNKQGRRKGKGTAWAGGQRQACGCQVQGTCALPPPAELVNISTPMLPPHHARLRLLNPFA